MYMKKLLLAWGMALTLVGGNVASVWATTDFVGSLGCGAMECLDVYHVKCGGPTHYLYGYIEDNDSGNDYVVLTLTALAPGPIKGTAVAAMTPGTGPGAAASTALLRQGTSIGAMQAYATVGNASGDVVAYLLAFHCYDITFSIPTLTTATQIQDQ